MALMVFLLMSIVAHVSSEDVICQVDFAQGKKNEYINLVIGDTWGIDKTEVLKEVTPDAGLMIKYKLSNDDEAELGAGKVALCYDNPAEDERFVMHLLGKALGLWGTIPCPVKMQTVNEPPRKFNESYEFGESTDVGILVDIELLNGRKTIVQLAMTAMRAEKKADDS